MNDLDIRFKNEAELEMRVRQLEKRLASLEKEVSCKTPLSYEEVLTRLHGEDVGKTDAARMLGVTKGTVYNMLKDGRIDAACNGKRVSVRSIARHIDAQRRAGKYAD